MQKYFSKGIICLLAFMVFYIFFSVIIYFIPLYHYEDLLSKKNLTKKEVDKTLYMYYKLKTSFNTFPLKNSIDIKDNEYFVRYLMLGLPSIDVIYDENNKVVGIFDTYE